PSLETGRKHPRCFLPVLCNLMKPCAFCKQPIHPAATRCQHCHANQPQPPAGNTFEGWWMLLLLWLLISMLSR
ncbi:MAG: hypothetical protein KC425_27240, partial [Anaerolineales bacterium]|nr:hypothetical protein [Anaerolineales bacterium]